MHSEAYGQLEWRFRVDVALVFRLVGSSDSLQLFLIGWIANMDYELIGHNTRILRKKFDIGLLIINVGYYDRNGNLYDENPCVDVDVNSKSTVGHKHLQSGFFPFCPFCHFFLFLFLSFDSVNY